MTLISPMPVVPDPPICRSAKDESQYCEFAAHCSETRQRVQSGYRKTEAGGHWAQLGATMWGALCWAWQGFRDRGVTPSTEPVGAPVEREPGEEPPF